MHKNVAMGGDMYDTLDGGGGILGFITTNWRINLSMFNFHIKLN